MINGENITREEARILSHFGAGMTTREIAADLKMPRADVVVVVDHLAGNNRATASRLAEEYVAEHGPLGQPVPKAADLDIRPIEPADVAYVVDESAAEPAPESTTVGAAAAVTVTVDSGPVLDGNGDPVQVPDGIAVDEAFRAFMASRVPAPCGHYIAKVEADAGFDRCEWCPADPAAAQWAANTAGGVDLDDWGDDEQPAPAALTTADIAVVDPAPLGPVAPLPDVRDRAELLEAAARSGEPALVAAASAIQRLLAELQDLYGAAQRQRATRARVAVLREQLAAAEAELAALEHGGPGASVLTMPPPTAAGPPMPASLTNDKTVRDAIRRWADTKDVACPATGRVPRDVAARWWQEVGSAAAAAA